ncbi:mitochondrial small ribosomal subunit Rsm22-domain-containing protein [Rhodocollybia butyracea]|uniref:Mitochondrial small ribosomal subunit Rsm22-domain-containing protein n=1 Tax=Rhodocollybia butyracea TaxID=206335 RepID=A0A9P5Q408_9AGAR|nr:mitochondrial small ribosomal subunit Rsm22-domain-containing protein [Rhodocollybia butyracea]
MSLFVRVKWKIVIRNTHSYRALSSSTAALGKVNPSLNLDPSLQALLKDVDISLTRHKTSFPSHRELDIIPPEMDLNSEITVQDPEDSFQEDSLERKSPAAVFGSKGIGAVVLPLEMQNSINLLISESDKSMLHNDAKRLFQENADTDDAEWGSTFEAKYRSRQQSSRHSERDGTAFASVALPAHYSAILAVLTHVKHRLGPDWNISKVIDWGAGTGSGLWASVHTFQQNAETSQDVEGLKVSDTSLESYVGIDKRDGLVTIGKRLLREIKRNDLSVSWQRVFHEEDRMSRDIGQHTLALSAFNLSSLPTNIARKTLVKEMWESGAHTIVLIDHNTSAGFENIAEARQVLLKMGRKETEDPTTEDWPIKGSHVVAPCPHDGECPLHHPGSTRLVCGFSQRLQRPSFVRLTKHSPTGHEDTGYSYVVIQRGERPTRPESKLGRIGAIGKRELDKVSAPQVVIKELSLHNESNVEEMLEAPTVDQAPIPASEDSSLQLPFDEKLQAELRQEAYSWPRLVFSPLKKSGHIILDACTPEGKIMRMTVPKSQGKQPYYDARKSSWGDIFPHEPKNAPQERYQPRRAKREGGTTAMRGSDIGKRRVSSKQTPVSYETLSDSIKDTRKKSKRDRVEGKDRGQSKDSDTWAEDADD